MHRTISDIYPKISSKEGLPTRNQQMQYELEQINVQINNIKRQLKTLPKGKLICAKNGKYSKWYHSDGHNVAYIPKRDRNKAEQLAMKKYLSLQLEDLMNEKNALESYLKYQHNSVGRANQLLIDKSEYKTLLEPYFKVTSQELAEWTNSPFERNEKYPERLIHKSISGHLLRSKSEVMIDMQLYSHRIPFRYECALECCGTTIYPDFTIRHPQTGEIFYWEHFGMMDDLNYSKTVCSKLQFYISNNIIPTINLITTFETKSCPLSVEAIEKIIVQYFAN